MPECDWRIRDVEDNGEFLSWATVDFIVDGKVVESQTFCGSCEEPPGYTGAELARSAATAWWETATYTAEERLGPFGLEWARERGRNHETADDPTAPLLPVLSDPYGSDFGTQTDPFVCLDEQLNYEVVFDSTYSSIVPTGTEEDGCNVFATFKEAKVELLRYLRSQRDEYADAVRRARVLTKEETT